MDRLNKKTLVRPRPRRAPVARIVEIHLTGSQRLYLKWMTLKIKLASILFACWDKICIAKYTLQNHLKDFLIGLSD